MEADWRVEAAWWSSSTVAAALCMLFLHFDSTAWLIVLAVPAVRYDLGRPAWFRSGRPWTALLWAGAGLVVQVASYLIPPLLMLLVPLILSILTAPAVASVVGGSYLRRWGMGPALAVPAAGIALAVASGPATPVVASESALAAMALFLIAAVVLVGSSVASRWPGPADKVVPFLYGFAAAFVFLHAGPLVALPFLVAIVALQLRGETWWTLPVVVPLLWSLDPWLPGGWLQRGILAALFVADVAFVAYRRLRAPRRQATLAVAG